MSYRLLVENRAAHELYRLPKHAVGRIRAGLIALTQNPRPPGARKLTGREGYRIRVGAYRVLYTVEDQAHVIRIYRIGHRKDICR